MTTVPSSVTTIIVNFRTAELTAAAALSALHAGADEVRIVDNDSNDDSLTILAAIRDRRVSVLRQPRNTGFGRAANAGARGAVSEVLLFLNSDATIDVEALQRLVADVADRGGRAIVGSRLVTPDGTIQRSAGLLPAPFDLVVRALGLDSIGRWAMSLPLLGRLVAESRLATEHRSAEMATAPVETNMVSGACFAIGREAFEELGGFDERYFMYFEDADLCRRAAVAGMPIRYLPDAVVTHVGGASSIGDYRFSPMHARSMRQYLQKWWGPPGAILAFVLLALRLGWYAITLRRGTRRSFDALRGAFR